MERTVSGTAAHPTRWWTRLDDGRVRCDVCPRACALHEAFVRDLAERLGGIEVLDGALMKLFEHRAPAAALELGPGVGAELVARLDAARFARARVGLVPKLGRRTLGVDLFA